MLWTRPEISSSTQTMWELSLDVHENKKFYLNIPLEQSLSVQGAFSSRHLNLL